MVDKMMRQPWFNQNIASRQAQFAPRMKGGQNQRICNLGLGRLRTERGDDRQTRRFSQQIGFDPEFAWNVLPVSPECLLKRKQIPLLLRIGQNQPNRSSWLAPTVENDMKSVTVMHTASILFKSSLQNKDLMTNL